MLKSNRFPLEIPLLMKYILATVGIAALVSIGTWMAVRPHALPEKDPVLVVNHRKFTRQEFDARYQERSHPAEDLKNFTDSIFSKPSSCSNY